LQECEAKHIVTIDTATTPDEAAALQEAGVRCDVASGFEAGGHRVHSSRSAQDRLRERSRSSLRSSTSIDVPVIAAGGIGDHAV